MTIGTLASAQPTALTPPANTPAEIAAPAQTAPDKSQFDAYADKQRAELHSFIEAAKADLDQMEKKETARLEAVAKRVQTEPFVDADKAKIKSLQELMTSSSAETREEALRDLKDKLRTEKVKAIWTNYKMQKQALWAKLTQDWRKLLMRPPLMIPKNSENSGTHGKSRPAR